MKLKNAIKKLSKYGELKVDNEIFYSIKVENYKIEFLHNKEDDQIYCIQLRGEHDVDDIQSDLFHGIWCQNLKSAILLAENLSANKTL